MIARFRNLATAVLCAVLVAGCGGGGPRGLSSLPAAPTGGKANDTLGDNYIIGPLDSLQVFVWRNPELTTNVTVRPDGRITVPLISDLPAAGKTPTALADDIKAKLAEFIQNPQVQVIVSSFNGPFSQQVRVLGEAAKPQSLPYRANMTLLDVMIAVGGLTEFAAGDKATLIRVDRASGKQTSYSLKISKLLRRGDASANVRIEPGDVILIPQSFL
jgi:polysaccharide export outer membrane protein